MGWREILIKNPRDKRDKSPQSNPQDHFCHYCPQDSEIENRESMYSFGGDAEFMSILTDDQKQYYLGLLEIMQSPKFGLDRETAEQEARMIVDEYRERKKVESDE